MGEVVSSSPPPTPRPLPVSIPISLPHLLTVPRLGAMAPGPDVDSPSGVSSTCQQVSAVAQEVVMAPVKGAVVEAGPGGTGGRGTLAPAPELGHSPCQGLQQSWRLGAAWGRGTTVSL